MEILFGSILVFILIVWGLYCCVRAGAEADRRLEYIFWLWEREFCQNETLSGQDRE